jgi:argininosuccinate lyase
MKMWSGRFTKDTDSFVEAFTASLPFDKEFYLEDILGSAAHVRMLHKIGILSESELKTILNTLRTVLSEFEAGSAKLLQNDEDIHMAVERLLKEKIGETAGKIHTARSRNDQVTLDMHMYLRSNIVSIIELIVNLQEALLNSANKYNSVIIPGYTHLQRAQPVLFAHHLLAYYEMLARDIERFKDSLSRMNLLPLGSGALAGTTFPIDRQYVAYLLNFDGVSQNSMDGVSNRDYVVEFCFNCSLLMTHLSRLSEEIILWASKEFNFIELDDAYCTGSSIMPQKKNPDVAELVRGKTGRVYGSLIGILTVLKSLPLSYNKDFQEDKEGFLDALITVKNSLFIYAPMITSMRVKEEHLKDLFKCDFSNATDLADYLAKKGIPFRTAHEITGKLVVYCIEQGKGLLDLPLSHYKQESPLIENDIYEALAIENVVNRRESEGGTGKTQVLHQLTKAQSKLTEYRSLISQLLNKYTLDKNKLLGNSIL